MYQSIIQNLLDLGARSHLINTEGERVIQINWKAAKRCNI